MITICCPTPTALASVITGTTCPVNFGQIQKLIFWRHGNYIGSVATAEIEATWTALLAATGDTKALVSPFVSAGVLAPGEARQFGSGNEVIDGIPIIIGSEPSTFEGKFMQYAPSVGAAMKDLMCEDLDVIFVNENGQFGYRLSGNDFYGFHVKGLFVGDFSIPGYAEPSSNAIRFMIPSGEMDGFTISNSTTFALNMVNS